MANRRAALKKTTLKPKNPMAAKVQKAPCRRQRTREINVVIHFRGKIADERILDVPLKQSNKLMELKAKHREIHTHMLPTPPGSESSYDSDDSSKTLSVPDCDEFDVSEETAVATPESEPAAISAAVKQMEHLKALDLVFNRFAYGSLLEHEERQGEGYVMSIMHIMAVCGYKNPSYRIASKLSVEL